MSFPACYSLSLFLRLCSGVLSPFKEAPFLSYLFVINFVLVPHPPDSEVKESAAVAAPEI